jgi:ribosomal protein S19
MHPRNIATQLLQTVLEFLTQECQENYLTAEKSLIFPKFVGFSVGIHQNEL